MKRAWKNVMYLFRRHRLQREIYIASVFLDGMGGRKFSSPNYVEKTWKVCGKMADACLLSDEDLGFSDEDQFPG